MKASAAAGVFLIQEKRYKLSCCYAGIPLSRIEYNMKMETTS